MASPLTIYFAGMGTVVGALAIGFSTAVMLTSPLPSEKEQPSAFEKRAEPKPEKPAAPATETAVNAPSAASPEQPISPLITAIQTPVFATTGSATAPAAAPAQSTTGQASDEPKLAPDPGMRQVPARPAVPVQAAAPPSTQMTPPAQTAAPVAAPPPAQVAAPPPVQPATRPREMVRNPDTAGSIDPVTGEWKKKEKRDGYAQRKQRKPVEQARPAPEIEEAEEVVETRAATGYAPEPRARAPLGIFNLLLGTGN